MKAAPWKLIVRTFKSNPSCERRALVEKAILEATGLPLRIREARRRLFILTSRATEEKPSIIETDGGFVCLIALDDLVDIVMEPMPTLWEVMRDAGVRGFD